MYPTLDELRARLPDTPHASRFLAKVRVGTVPAHWPELGPCLIWTAATTDKGYAVFRGGDLLPNGRTKLIPGHQWLHLQLHGPIAKGYELDHVCHDRDLCTAPGKNCPHRPCVLHTTPKLIRINRLDNNAPAGRNSRKRYCEGAYGPHDFADPENVYHAPDGSIKCRPCQVQRKAAWEAKARRLRAAAAETGMQPAGRLTLIS